MLRPITSALTAGALAATVTVWAQEPAPAQPDRQPPTETVSGCVIEARTTDGGTVYVLNDAVGGSGTIYVLAGSAQSDWTANANKKVEVTGPVQQPNERPAEDSGSATAKVVRPPVIEVESVKVIAETCK
jgi:hypothetical protein